ncbi:MAG: flagellin [Oligoflexales bacterium]
MAFIINNKVISDSLTKHLDKARKEYNDSLEKLSSGQVFTSSDPRPSERALAEGLEFKLRGLSASKRNINDAVSLLQTAEAGLSEVNNIVMRLKEINVSAASTTLTDNERKFLFVEYEALMNEINRISETTEFNGIPLLNGESERAPESLIFHVGDSMHSDENADTDVNSLRFDDFKSVVATTDGLGLRSALDLLGSAGEDGISFEDAQDLMVPDDEEFTTVYDMALDRLNMHRAVFGAMQERLNRALDYNDVFAENIAAAKSKIADTDYAQEVSKMAHNNILIQATTGLLAQNNMNANLTLSLIGSILK